MEQRAPPLDKLLHVPQGFGEDSDLPSLPDELPVEAACCSQQTLSECACDTRVHSQIQVCFSSVKGDWSNLEVVSHLEQQVRHQGEALAANQLVAVTQTCRKPRHMCVHQPCSNRTRGMMQATLGCTCCVQQGSHSWGALMAAPLALHCMSMMHRGALLPLGSQKLPSSGHQPLKAGHLMQV